MMQNRQLLEETTHEIVVKAYGNSMEDVVGKLFQIMRKQIFKEFDKPIIQMEAQEVYFESVDVKKTTEKFMFLFWPREKAEYTVTARIVVNVKYLDITKEDL